MNIKLLTEQHLEFLSLTRGWIGSSESTHVKMPHCWKSRVAAQMHRPKCRPPDRWIRQQGRLKDDLAHMRKVP